MKVWTKDEYDAVRYNNEGVKDLLSSNEGKAKFELLKLVLQDTNGTLLMLDPEYGYAYRPVVEKDVNRLCLPCVYRAPGDWAPMFTSKELDAYEAYRKAFILQARKRDRVVRFQLKYRGPNDRVIKFVYPGSPFIGTDICAEEVLADNPVPKNNHACCWSSEAYSMMETTKEEAAREIKDFRPSCSNSVRVIVKMMTLDETAPKEQKLPVFLHDGLFVVEYRGHLVSLTAVGSIKSFVAWEFEDGSRSTISIRVGCDGIVAKYVIVKE